MNLNNEHLLCPFCGQGTLDLFECGSCKKDFLLCDECESIYLDKNSLKDEFPSGRCPHCNSELIEQ